MLSLTNIITLLAASASFVTFTSALPSPIGLSVALSARAPTNTTDAGVQLCTEPNFGGQCYHAVWPKNSCIDLRG
jgi:hypothetical protein